MRCTLSPFIRCADQQPHYSTGPTSQEVHLHLPNIFCPPFFVYTVSTPSKKVSGSESIGHDFCEQIVSIQGLSFAQVKVYEGVASVFCRLVFARGCVAEDGAARNTVHKRAHALRGVCCKSKVQPKQGNTVRS